MSTLTYREKYKNLQKEFEQYKKESIKWSVEDFLSLEVEGTFITKENAQKALEQMIEDHNFELGITWDTLNSYYDNCCEECIEGTEPWRGPKTRERMTSNIS